MVAASAALCSIGVMTLVPASVAAAATTDITSTGPLTDIGISSDLNCSVNHTGDTAGEWFGDTACGTLLASGGTLYGPASIPAGASASPRTPWTAVSQTAVTGSGTTSDPFKIVTVDAAGTTGLQVTETDTYVVGQESYRNDVKVTNTGNASASGVLYRGGDCFLQNSDFGFGIHDSSTGAITCTTSLTPGSRIEQMLPLTPGSNYFEGFFDTLWADIGTQNPLPNTCDCSTDEDNSVGLSWGMSVGAGASETFSSVVTFSPLGSQPLALTKTADAANVAAGGSDGYTVTAHNPNSGSVTLASLTDTIGAGFSYQPGSTTGATTANPTISGQTLTWGPITVPGGGTASLHFGVTASTTPGTYTDDAEGTATGFTVVGTGAAAPVTVGRGTGCPPTVKHVFAIGNPRLEIVRVLITGRCLSGANHVMFGSLAATSFTVGYGGNIVASPPQQPAGTVDVTVTTPGGTSALNPPSDQYTYWLPRITQVLPNHGPVTGGNTVLIRGFMFSGTPAPTVSFGTGNFSSSVVVTSDGIIHALVPPHSSGTVDVQVTAFTGTSLPTSLDHYNYK